MRFDGESWAISRYRSSRKIREMRHCLRHDNRVALAAGHRIRLPLLRPMQISLLNAARDGWNGEACSALIGSTTWMAWRAGAALKEAGHGQPVGVARSTPFASLPGRAPQNVFVDIVPEGGPPWSAVFVVRHGKWVFDRLQFFTGPPRISSRITFWLQRRGWL